MTTYHHPFQSVDIVPPPLLERIIMAAPDTELLLCAKLSFHHFVGPGELKRMSREQFVYDHKSQSIQLFVPSFGSKGHGRYIPISGRDSVTLKALLPHSGSLFSSRDPWGRLRRFARTLHVDLKRGCARNSCLTNAVVAGCPWEEVAASAGITLRPNRHIYSPISRAEAEAYFDVELGLARIAHLPRRSGRLSSVETLK